MTPREKQLKEIETIKPRTITLNLSDADVFRINSKAAENNITVSEILEGFIGNLVYGTYSFGSDEEMLANEYFNRCCYGMGLNKTFLQYVAEYGFMKTILSNFETIIENEFLISKYPDDEEYIEQLKEEIEWAEETINEYYEDYSKSTKEPQEKEEAMIKIREWVELYKKMKGDE